MRGFQPSAIAASSIVTSVGLVNYQNGNKRTCDSDSQAVFACIKRSDSGRSGRCATLGNRPDHRVFSFGYFGRRDTRSSGGQAARSVSEAATMADLLSENLGQTVQNIVSSVHSPFEGTNPAIWIIILADFGRRNRCALASGVAAQDDSCSPRREGRRSGRDVG